MLTKMCLALIVILIALIFIPSLNAYLVEVNVSAEGVRADYTLILNQNFTSLEYADVVVDPSTSEGIARALEAGLRKLSPNVGVSDLQIEVMAAGNSLKLFFSFRVLGASARKGNLILVDCSWKSFSVDADLVAKGIHFNRVGEAYLRPPIEPYSNSSNFRMWVNGTRQVFPSEGVNIAGNVTVLNLANFQQPLDSWNRTFFLENRTTRWYLKPEPLVNMTATYRAENASLRYRAVLEHAMQVNAPGLANVENDVIALNMGQSGYEALFTLIIGVTFVFSLVFYVAERRAGRRILRKRK